MSHVATAVTAPVIVVSEASASDHPVADALLSFDLQAYQPSESFYPPFRKRRPRGLPGSIKDAIIRWLDEQV